MHEYFADTLATKHKQAMEQMTEVNELHRQAGIHAVLLDRIANVAGFEQAVHGGWFGGPVEFAAPVKGGASAEERKFAITLRLVQPHLLHLTLPPGVTNEEQHALDLVNHREACATFVRALTTELGVRGEKSKLYEGSNSLVVTWTLPDVIVTATDYQPPSCEVVEEEVTEEVKNAVIVDGKVFITRKRNKIVCEPPEEATAPVEG